MNVFDFNKYLMKKNYENFNTNQEKFPLIHAPDSRYNWVQDYIMDKDILEKDLLKKVLEF